MLKESSFSIWTVILALNVTPVTFPVQLFSERGFVGCVGQGYREGKTEVSMQERFQYAKAYPDAYKAMLALTQAVERTGLAPQLIDLINYRISQLNGCAFCLDMHSKDLRARGETEQRLYMMSAWREAPHLYSSRERAALAWAEAVTRLEDQQIPDAVYDIARKEFSEAELTQLTLAVVAINGWNRFNVAFHTPAGGYKSPIVRKTG